jgi:hypothetical protein
MNLGLLKQLSEVCRCNQRKFIFELLVPPTDEQLLCAGGDKSIFDRQARLLLMQQTLRALQDADIEPGVLKVESLGSHADGERMVQIARRGGAPWLGLRPLAQRVACAGDHAGDLTLPQSPWHRRAAVPGHRHARAAANSMRKQVAAMSAALCGLDTLVFSGRIGEHEAQARATFCSGLSWIGVSLGDSRNRSASNPLSEGPLRCQVLVLASKEDEQIARHAWRLLT